MAKDAVELVADVMTLLDVWVWDGVLRPVAVENRLSYPMWLMLRKSLPDLRVARRQWRLKLL